MSKVIRGIRGFRDIPPDEAFRHQYAEDRTRQHFNRFGYREVKLPLVEPTELFTRGIGEATDIVEKEMYTFQDRNGASLSLRPEGTASAVRAYLEGGWAIQGGVTKIFYSGPMFRYERPQKGRYRQFYQIGLEALGGSGPLVDVEVIDVLHKLFVDLGVEDVKILINSLGCPICRPSFREDLIRFIKKVAGDLCSNCIRRIETNPMRVMDCKVPSCREAMEKAPIILEYLCPECDHHFTRLTEALSGLNVPFEVDPRIVRGLDYYNRTAFEAVCGRLGSQDAVAAGGRYDGLAREIGGDATGIGFAIGLERLTLVMNWSGIEIPSMDFYIVAATDTARVDVMEVADALRRKGYYVETDLEDRSLKAQLRSANRMGAGHVIIVGDDELSSGTLQVKDFSKGEQKTVDRKSFLGEIKLRRRQGKGEDR